MTGDGLRFATHGAELAAASALQALEHGGQAADRLMGTPVGVFVGLSGADYLQLELQNLKRRPAVVATLVVFRIPTGLRAWIEDVVVDDIPPLPVCPVELPEPPVPAIEPVVCPSRGSPDGRYLFSSSSRRR